MSKVTVIGAGGLGVPVVAALAQRSCRISVIEHDTVELSNLHRQVLYRTADAGRPKVDALIEALASDVIGELVATVEPHREALNAESIERLLVESDVVIDATDSIATKLLVNDYCVSERIPYCYGGVIGEAGQAMLIAPGGPCLRCAFGDIADEELPALGGSCHAAGIYGPVAGVVGALQAELASSILDGHPPERRMIRFAAGGPALTASAIAPATGCPLGCGRRITARFDLRSAICPQTFLFAKLALEDVEPGAAVELRFKTVEIARSVAAALSEEGHAGARAVEIVPGCHRMVVER